MILAAVSHGVDCPESWFLLDGCDLEVLLVGGSTGIGCAVSEIWLSEIATCRLASGLDRDEIGSEVAVSFSCNGLFLFLNKLGCEETLLTAFPLFSSHECELASSKASEWAVNGTLFRAYAVKYSWISRSETPCSLSSARSRVFSTATFRPAAWTSRDAWTPRASNLCRRCSRFSMYSLRRARERRWLSRIRADDVNWSVWNIVSL